jgi:hypothetical protein
MKGENDAWFLILTGSISDCSKTRKESQEYNDKSTHDRQDPLDEEENGRRVRQIWSLSGLAPNSVF